MSGDYHKREAPLFQGKNSYRQSWLTSLIQIHPVDLALKDANHALDLVGTQGAKMRNVETARDHLKVVQQEKKERGDIAAIVSSCLTLGRHTAHLTLMCSMEP